MKNREDLLFLQQRTFVVFNFPICVSCEDRRYMAMVVTAYVMSTANGNPVL